MTETTKEFYTVRELAELLDINMQTVYRLVRRGELPCHSIGRAKRFSRADVEAFLQKCRTLTNTGATNAD